MLIMHCSELLRTEVRFEVWDYLVQDEDRVTSLRRNHNMENYSIDVLELR